jgi:hypothetical protein
MCGFLGEVSKEFTVYFSLTALLVE